MNILLFIIGFFLVIGAIKRREAGKKFKTPMIFAIICILGGIGGCMDKASKTEETSAQASTSSATSTATPKPSAKLSSKEKASAHDAIVAEYKKKLMDNEVEEKYATEAA